MWIRGGVDIERIGNTYKMYRRQFGDKNCRTVYLTAPTEPTKMSVKR